MSFSLNKIQKGIKREPRKIIIYGPPKLGKSTLSGSTKEKHGCKRIFLDTLDWFEPLLHEYICHEKGFKSLTDDHNKETANKKV